MNFGISDLLFLETAAVRKLPPFQANPFSKSGEQQILALMADIYELKTDVEGFVGRFN